MTQALKIDAAEWYTLQDIVRLKLFPWASSFWSVRNVVAQDRILGNLLKATITGTGRGTKYHFKGSNIIKFINSIETGDIRSTHKKHVSTKRTGKVHASNGKIGRTSRAKQKSIR